MRCTIVVVAYRSRAPLTRFLEGLDGRVGVVVVDNSAAEDGLGDLAERFPGVRVVDAGGNVGFSAGANTGARHVDTPHVVFMNPDTLPDPDVLEALVAALESDATVAACGPTGIGTAGGGAQPSLGRVLVHVLGLHRWFPLAGVYFYPRHGERVQAGWISGSCCAMRTAEFSAIGGYDESYFVFMSDFELGLRLAESGRRQVVLGDVVMRHVDGGSSDLPSEWTWDQRGRGWAQFLVRTQPRWKAVTIAALLVVGFSARRVLYGASRRSAKAAEQSAMVRALLDEWRKVEVPTGS